VTVGPKQKTARTLSHIELFKFRATETQEIKLFSNHAAAASNQPPALQVGRETGGTKQAAVDGAGCIKNGGAAGTTR
jgi:hypothetical protein